ncbi:MAG: hypothetical protein ABEH43_11970, partial [Flavobacteriales bacterium]
MLHNKYHIEKLKNDILRKEGVIIPNTSFCERLSGSILQKAKKYVSRSTLLRFYGLVPARSKTSKNTLDSLTQYLGYNNWEEYVLKHSNPDLKKQIVPDKNGIHLLELCLKNHEFKSVIDYLKDLSEDDLTETFRHEIREKFADILRHDKRARNVLIPELAKIEQGRKYFFEGFVDFVFLHEYYADGL